jgi:DEAD/DEAH box helicase
MDDSYVYSSDESEQLDQIRQKLARRQPMGTAVESSPDNDVSDDEPTTTFTSKQHKSTSSYPVPPTDESTAVFKSTKHIDSDDDMDEFATDTNVLLAILNGDCKDYCHLQIGGVNVGKEQNASSTLDNDATTDQRLTDNGTKSEAVLNENINISTSLNIPCKEEVPADSKYKVDADCKYNTNCRDSFYGIGLTATPCDDMVDTSSVESLREQHDVDNDSFGSCDISSDSYLRAVNAAMDNIASPKKPELEASAINVGEPSVTHNYQPPLEGERGRNAAPIPLYPIQDPLMIHVDRENDRIDNSLNTTKHEGRAGQLDDVENPLKVTKDVRQSQDDLPHAQSPMYLKKLPISNITKCSIPLNERRDAGNANYPSNLLQNNGLDSNSLIGTELNITEACTEICRSEMLANGNVLNTAVQSPGDECSDIESVALLPNYERVIRESFDPEMDYRLYAPPSAYSTHEPILHNFTLQSKPIKQRPLLSISELFDPPLDQLWNSRYKKFNQMQSELGNILAYSDDRIVVTAPTGAGKTVVFEMAIARFFDEDLKHFVERNSRYSKITKYRKIIYLSPNKALCLGVEVAVVTGDGDPSESFREIANAHLVITTPEKWDSVTRRWSENFVLFSTVKLILVDEVHLLADESRGSCLEAVICRLKTIQRACANINFSNVDISVSRYVLIIETV